MRSTAARSVSRSPDGTDSSVRRPSGTSVTGSSTDGPASSRVSSVSCAWPGLGLRARRSSAALTTLP